MSIDGEETYHETYISLDEAEARFFDEYRTESIAEIVAQLSPSDREFMLTGVDMDAYLYDWTQWGRPKQIIPDFPYFNVHLLLTGRGFGKTRAMSEWVREKAMAVPGTRIALMGRTNGETRDVLCVGESGVVNIPQPEEDKPVYKASEGKVVWPNGSEAKILSAETPDAVRGTQFHYAAVDEFAAHTPYVGNDGLTAFQNLRIATRLGEFPMLVVATTPKRVKALRDLIEEAKDPEKSIRIVRGKTDENKSNLSSAYMGVIHGQFDGTAAARQELDGEMLDEDPEGALWKADDILHIEDGRGEEFAYKLPLRIVAIDPSVSDKTGDECGIVVVGATNERLMHKRRGYVLEDASGQYSPEEWAQKAVDLHRKWKTLGVVIEGNQGHALLTLAIHNIDPSIRVFRVNARVSKKERAVPVAQIYEQHRVRHLYPFPVLEGQMENWEPAITKESPDRIDALVHGLTALMIISPDGLVVRGLRSKVPPGRLPDGFGKGFHRRLE